jgi:hypothetical protein
MLKWKERLCAWRLEVVTLCVWSCGFFEVIRTVRKVTIKDGIAQSLELCVLQSVCKMREFV